MRIVGRIFGRIKPMSFIQKYIWVIKTIHRAGRITLKELNSKIVKEVLLTPSIVSSTSFLMSIIGLIF